MKAMACEGFGGPEVVAERDVPDPPPPTAGEIQVRIEARGVQYVDVLMLAGKYQFRPEPPFIPGGEAASTIVAVGPEVNGFRMGDAVMSRQTLGAFADPSTRNQAQALNLTRLPPSRTRPTFSLRDWRKTKHGDPRARIAAADP